MSWREYFAKNGYDLLITGGSEQIEEAGRELEVQTLQCDLARYEGVEKLWRAVESTGVGDEKEG